MADNPQTEDGSREQFHILLVEDNPGDVRLMKEAFDEVSHDVTLHDVRNAEEAVSYLLHLDEFHSVPDPDLVLLDLNLQRGDGFDVLAVMKSNDDLRSTPVLVLTSSRATGDMERSYDLHANAYLTKPVDPDAVTELAKSIATFWFDHVRLPPD